VCGDLQRGRGGERDCGGESAVNVCGEMDVYPSSGEKVYIESVSAFLVLFVRYLIDFMRNASSMTMEVLMAMQIVCLDSSRSDPVLR